MAKTVEEMRAAIAQAKAPKEEVPQEGPSIDEMRQQIAAARPAPTQGEIVTDDVEAASGVGLMENLGRLGAKTVAEVYGFPGDVALGIGMQAADLALPNSVVSDEELNILDERYDVSRAFEKMMNSLGVRTDVVEPRSGGERLLHNVVGPVAGGLLGLGTAAGTTGAVGNAVRQNFKRYAGADATAATAGGLAKTGVEVAGGGELASTGVELVANLVAGGFADRLMGLGNLARKTQDAAKNTISDYNSRERSIARDFFIANLERAGENVDRVVSDVAAPGSPGAELLTPGAKARSPALQALEKSIIGADPRAADLFAHRKMEFDDFIRAQFRVAAGEPGLTDAVIDAYRASVDYRIDLVEKRLQQAIEDARKLVESAPPGLYDDWSTPVKRILQRAEKEAREIESELWNNLPIAEVPMIRITDTYKEIMDEARVTGEAFGLEDFPASGTEIALKRLAGAEESADDAVTLLDKDGRPLKETPKTPAFDPNATTSTDEVIDFRKTMLERAAEAAANQKRSLSRRYYMLADAAMATLEEMGKDLAPEAAQAYNDARTFSKNLNDRFTRDVIAPLLAVTPNRSELVPGNELMENLIRRGEAGRTNMIALKAAARGIPPQAKTSILQKFWIATLKDGKIDTNAAKNFLSGYHQLLEEAGLLDMVESIAAAASRADVAAQDIVRARQAIKSEALFQVASKYGMRIELEDALPTMTREQASNYVSSGRGLVDAIGVAFRNKAGASQTKLRAMFDEIMALQGVSPEEKRVAVAGLRSAIMEGAVAALYRESGDPVTGVSQVATRIRVALENTGRFTDAQIERVTELSNLIEAANEAATRQTFKGESNTAKDLQRNFVMGQLLRYISVRYFANWFKGEGPGALTIAGQSGRLGERIGEKIGVQDAFSLVTDAIFDQNLWVSLMKHESALTDGDVGNIKRALSAIKKGSMGLLRFGAGSMIQPSQTTVLQGLGEEITEARNGE